MHWHNEYQPIINGQTSVHYNVLPINHQNTNIIVLTYYLITKPSTMYRTCSPTVYLPKSPCQIVIMQL